jgi:hypothetical protein
MLAESISAGVMRITFASWLVSVLTPTAVHCATSPSVGDGPPIT